MAAPATYRLVEELLDVLRKPQAAWNDGDELLLLTVYAPSNRGALVHAMTLIHHMGPHLNGPLRYMVRAQLAAGLDWNRILNPAVRTGWAARMRLKSMQLELERAIARGGR